MTALQTNTAIKDAQLVLFRIGDEEFGVDIGQVKEIIKVGKITGMPGANPYIDGIINLRGTIMAIINLRRMMGLEEKQADSDSRIIVLEGCGISAGVMVDSVTEVQYINSRQVDMLPQMLTENTNGKYIKGVCNLSNRLFILIDLWAVTAKIDMNIIKT